VVGVRKVGVEEELMLVDPETGRLRQSSHRAIAADHAPNESEDGQAANVETVEEELFQSQLETNSKPCATLSELRDSLIRGRREAIEAAEAVDCAAVAVATPVLGFVRDDQEPAPRPRYRHIVDEYVDMTSVVSGMHVHVDAADGEAVGVLDRIRPWLPTLLALSVNSPFNDGRDTGHASWRAQLWGRWPTAGPAEPFGDLGGYRAATDAIIASGAAMDRGMLYLDARLAESYPTVEIRVADVCTELDDVVVIAAAARALVATAAEETKSGSPVPEWRTDLLRAARWRASRYGMARDLVHPATKALVRPRQVVGALLEHVGPALDEAGDREEVLRLVERLFAHGTGATRQRSVAEASGSLEAVVSDLRDRTAASVRG
jgi:carboxylate-amine ligase